MARTHLARIRKICLALPEAVEIEAWGAPTFRVGKIFAMYAQANSHHGDGREGIWVKTTHFTQDLLVRAQPTRYFSPPYVGPQGWTGVYLDGNTDWIAATVLIRDAWRATAPKRIAALLADDDEPASQPKAAAKAKSVTKTRAAKKTPRQKKKAPAKRAKK